MGDAGGLRAARARGRRSSRAARRGHGALSAAAALAVLLAPALPQARRGEPQGAFPPTPRAASGESTGLAAPTGPELRIRGGNELRVLTERALERLFATRVGARLREQLASGALPGPVTIQLNLRGDDFTPYRVPGEEPGETIVFDPWTLPEVETERGPRTATRETVLAHELGHAVLKLRSEERVIREVENPLRAELGLPLRVRF